MERKIESAKDQMKDRADIAKGKAKLTADKAKEDVREWGEEAKNKAEHTIDAAKEKMNKDKRNKR